MTHALILLIVTIVYSISCLISYSSTFKQSPWYFPVAIVLGSIGTSMWFYGCKLLATKEEIFLFGLMWDVVLVFVFYGIPIVLIGVKLDGWTALSAVLILAGILLLKFRPH